MTAPDFLSESAIDFVADGAENAGRRGDLSVPPCGWKWRGCGGDIRGETMRAIIVLIACLVVSHGTALAEGAKDALKGFG
jgi:hypothetical protein